MQTIEGLTVISRLCMLIKRTLDVHGCDGEALLRQAGIDYDSVNSTDTRISATEFQALWRVAVAATGDPCFGISVGEQVQPAALHGLGLSWLVSSNLRSGLQRLVQFQRVLSTNLDLQLDEGDDSYILSGKPRITSYTYEVASIDVYFALVVKMCRITFGAGFNPARVQLRHDLPACHKRYRDFFAAPVEFNADRYAIIFMKSTLEQYLPTANPMLARINDQVVYRYLADLDQQDIIINVRTKLIEALPAGRPTLNLIAKSLNISQRSLQRRLRDEGTGFREQVIAVRKPLAEQYLKEGGRAISEIAFLLGFTEPANFARAFREWTGYTPNEFRSVAKR